MSHLLRVVVLTTLVMSLVVPVSAVAQDVAVFGAPSTASWNGDVQAKIQGTALFSSVDEFLIDSSTPLLSTLQSYDAVLVYSDASFHDSDAIGDVLADYMDGGGGVVLCTFAFITPGGLGIGGRIVTDGYLPFTTASQNQNTQMQLVADLPGHELLQGVASFDGGTSSYHNSSISTVPGATQVAHWTNNQPLVSTWAPTR